MTPPGFDETKYVLDNKPISVVLQDGEATPAEVHSFTNIVPSHYAWVPQKPENTHERGDGSQGIWVGGVRGNFEVTVSEQDPALLDSIEADTRKVIVTNTLTGKTLTFDVKAGATRSEQISGEVVIRFHTSLAQGSDWVDLFTC